MCITLSLSIIVHLLTVLVSEITFKKLKNYETSFTKKSGETFTGFDDPCPYGKVGEPPNCYGKS